MLLGNIPTGKGISRISRRLLLRFKLLFCLLDGICEELLLLTDQISISRIELQGIVHIF